MNTASPIVNGMEIFLTWYQNHGYLVFLTRIFIFSSYVANPSQKIDFEQVTIDTFYAWQAESQELLASACKNWGAVNQFDDENSFWEHLIELNKNLDPLNLQVPAPIYGEFGGVSFDMQMADVVDECSKFWDYPDVSWDLDL